MLVFGEAIKILGYLDDIWEIYFEHFGFEVKDSPIWRIFWSGVTKTTCEEPTGKSGDIWSCQHEGHVWEDFRKKKNDHGLYIAGGHKTLEVTFGRIFLCSPLPCLRQIQVFELSERCPRSSQRQKMFCTLKCWLKEKPPHYMSCKVPLTSWCFYKAPISQYVMPLWHHLVFAFRLLSF